MLNVDFDPSFLEVISKIRNPLMKERIKKQISKVIDNPEIGKPMMHLRKGTRELYVSQFRLSYVYLHDANKLVFLDFYHKDEQ